MNLSTGPRARVPLRGNVRFRRKAMAAFAALLLATSFVASLAAPSARAGVFGFQPEITREWQVTLQRGIDSAINLSTPVAATMRGQPAVVVGDSAGYLDAYYLRTGAAVPGWPVKTAAAVYQGGCYPGAGVEAPISAENAPGGDSTIFAQIGGGNPSVSTGEPDFEAFGSSGRRLYATDPNEERGAACTGGGRVTGGNGSSPGLSGMALADEGGWDAYSGGSRGLQEWGVSATNGVRLGAFPFFNTDSALSTPAVGTLPGVGTEIVVEASDQTFNPGSPGSFSGGHLRVFNGSGDEICNANVVSPQPTNNYDGSSFDSSPAVGSFGGAPLVIVGEGSRWTGSDQLLAFNTVCQGQWSTTLAGQTNFSPSIANALGTGAPVAIEEVANVKAGGQPIVYEINGQGRIVHRTAVVDSDGRACSGVNVHTVNQSVVTADLSGGGYQDLIAPAGSCGYVVLDGQSLQEIAQLDPACDGHEFISSGSALATAVRSGGGTVDVTIAGFGQGTNDGCVFNYAVESTGGAPASLGADGWPEFHHDAQLSGIYDRASMTTDDHLGPLGELRKGQRITSVNGAFYAAMQANGQFAVYRREDVGDALLWRAPIRGGAGSTVWMQGDDNLVVYGSNGRAVWSSRTSTRPPAPPGFVVMQPDGNLVIYEEPAAPGPFDVPRGVWDSGS